MTTPLDDVMAITNEAALDRGGPSVMAITKDPVSPTLVTASEFQTAYDFFNAELFGGELPLCLITLQRGRYGGYYSSKRFQTKGGKKKTDEIAMNPRYFAKHSFEWVMSVLVHEMAHLWQEHFGTPSRSAYHNREFAEKMLWLGLRPTHNGEPDGKMTGQYMTHIIMEGGRFAVAVEKLKQAKVVSKITWHDSDPITPHTPEEKMRLEAEREQDRIAWETRRAENDRRLAEHHAEREEEDRLDELEEQARVNPGKGLSGKRTKYKCPKCGDHADGKATLHLICGKCDRRMIRDGLR